MDVCLFVCFYTRSRQYLLKDRLIAEKGHREVSKSAVNFWKYFQCGVMLVGECVIQRESFHCKHRQWFLNVHGISQANQHKTMLVKIFIALNNRSHFHNNFSPYLGPSAASVVTSSVASFPSFLFLGSSSCICFGRRTQSWKQPIINLNNTSTLESHASLDMKNVQKIAVFSYNVLLKSSSGFVHIIAVFTFII